MLRLKIAKMYCQTSVLYLSQILLAVLLQGWQKGGQGGYSSSEKIMGGLAPPKIICGYIRDANRAIKISNRAVMAF